jgi:hypothetical protein
LRQSVGEVGKRLFGGLDIRASMPFCQLRFPHDLTQAIQGSEHISLFIREPVGGGNCFIPLVA